MFEKTIRGLYKDDAEGILKEYRKSKINDLETSFKKCITDAFQHSASYSDRIMVRSDDGVVSWKEYVRVISVEKEINKIRDGKQKGSLQFMFGENNSTFVQFRDPDEKRSIIGALAKNR